MAAAPVNSWAARRAALPARLRERRRTEYRRDRHAFAAGVATGGAVAVVGIAIAAVALLFTGHQQVQPPNLVGPAQGGSAPGHPVPLALQHVPSATPSGTSCSQLVSVSVPVRVRDADPELQPDPHPSSSPTVSPGPSTTPTP